MALKRKRSANHLSSPTSSNSSGSDTSSSPLPTFFSHAKPVLVPYAKLTWPFPPYADKHPSHMGSRTRKRHRDNRPDEHMVHESTISKLFQAQRQRPDAAPAIPDTSTLSAAPQPAQRSTLHSFWKIAQPAPQDVNMAMDFAPQSATAVRCEDCDGPVHSEDSMDLDVTDQGACHVCRRSVCDACAVAVGGERTCSGCASRGW